MMTSVEAGMLRLKERVLGREGARYHYRGVLFTGVMYRQQANDFVRPVTVIDGVPSMEPDSTLISSNTLLDCTGSLYDADGDTVRIQHEGRPFDGFGCEFHGDHCIHEFEVVSGYIVARQRWNVSGELLRLTENKQRRQDYEWSANGALRRAEVSVPKRFLASLGFSKDGRGRLLSLSLDGAVWDGLNEARDIEHFPVRNIDMLDTYIADQALHLLGDQITDAVFAHLRQGMLNGHTEELYLRDTALSSAAIQAVISVPTLRYLRVHTSSAEQRMAIERVRTARPDLKISIE